ncbi:MAG: hypothetical protein AAGA62_05565, partial [Bacteroidota bacterium]
SVIEDEQFSANQTYRLQLTAELPEEAGIPSLDLRAGLPLKAFIIFHLPEQQMAFWDVGELAVNTLVSGQPTLIFDGEIDTSNRLVPGQAKIEFGLGYAGMPPLRGQSDLLEVVVE